jgi:hypothetical protein
MNSSKRFSFEEFGGGYGPRGKYNIYDGDRSDVDCSGQVNAVHLTLPEAVVRVAKLNAWAAGGPPCCLVCGKDVTEEEDSLGSRGDGPAFQNPMSGDYYCSDDCAEEDNDAPSF